jgi:hypothetical protein
MSVLSQGARALLDLKILLKPTGNQQWDSDQQKIDAMTMNLSAITALFLLRSHLPRLLVV